MSRIYYEPVATTSENMHFVKILEESTYFEKNLTPPNVNFEVNVTLIRSPKNGQISPKNSAK